MGIVIKQRFIARSLIVRKHNLGKSIVNVLIP